MANNLENKDKSTCLKNMETEAEKLKSTDKIHNFTNMNLPQDLKDLLNKGIKFIPTLSNANRHSVKISITKKVNEALCTVIMKKQPSSVTRKLKTHDKRRCYGELP